jgi:hypothetical protein
MVLIQHRQKHQKRYFAMYFVKEKNFLFGNLKEKIFFKSSWIFTLTSSNSFPIDLRNVVVEVYNVAPITDLCRELCSEMTELELDLSKEPTENIDSLQLKDIYLKNLIPLCNQITSLIFVGYLFDTFLLFPWLRYLRLFYLIEMWTEVILL